MKIYKIVLITFLFCCSMLSLAQKNKITDTKLWEYKDVIEIDSIHLHTYYKIDSYNVGDSYWTSYIHTFEANGMVYYQFFVALPLYTKTSRKTISNNNDTLVRYRREDTLMMFLNEDFSYRENGTNVFVDHAYAWYGLVFEKAVRADLTLEEREKIKLTFIKDAGYEIYNIQRYKKIQYFERIDSGYEYENYIKAIDSKAKRKPILFIPKYEPFK